MFGRIEEHNCEKETFHDYVERMANFSEANQIAGEKMQAVFLVACGAKTYETLKNGCLPQEVSDVEYGKIIDKLKTNFTPELFIILFMKGIFSERDCGQLKSVFQMFMST